MKKSILVAMSVLACLSLSACGTKSKSARESSEASSLKKSNAKLKKKIHHQKKKEQKSHSSSASSSSSQQGQQTQVSNNQQSAQHGVNNAEDAVAAARAKYGDQNGRIHWNYMIDGETGQPIRNADGSYFVKGTADNGTMTGTEYSVNVHPDGSISSN